MTKPARRRWSRRQILKFGLGAAVALTGGRLGETILANASTTPSSGQEIEVVRVLSVLGGSVTVKLSQPSRTVSAQLAMFPSGITPRVGDLVAVGEGAPIVPGSSPLCAPTNAILTAVPVATWTTGVLEFRSGSLTIGGRRLAQSPEALAAAQQGLTVSVHTLDTTLPDHQVLAIRQA